jgi:hypothetical protein
MYGLILLYTGRHYLLGAIRRAFTRLSVDDPDPVGPWAARILLLATASLVALLHVSFHVDLLIAAVYVAATLLFFLVVTRVVCETGIPFFQAEFDMSMVMGTVLGFPFLGPSSLVITYWLGSILNFDTRVSLMPFAANGFKLAEVTGLRLRSLVPAVLVAMVLALGLGLGAKLWTTYGVGSHRDDYHVLEGTASSVFDEATAALTDLDETGHRQIAENTHGLAKLPLIGLNTDHGRDIGFLLFGAAGIVIFSLLRYRFIAFPFHPVVFLIWGTWPSQNLWFSFLIGWALKKAVVTYGGPRAYHDGKPFFLGLIMGETMVAAFFIVTQLIYYLVMGVAKSSNLGYA